MNANLIFDFTVDKTTNTVHIKKEFAAKRPIVWDCHTKPELLDQWFAPKPYSAKTKFMDFREGGHWLFVMLDPEGKGHWTRMDYKKIKPIEGYSVKDSFCDENGVINNEMPNSEWAVRFSDLGESTLVETDVTFKSLEDVETSIKMGMKEGMMMVMEGLEEFLEKLSK